MTVGIRMYAAILSIFDIICLFDNLDIKRSRKGVHNWVQKVDRQPVSGESPTQMTVDETVIRINEQRFRLDTAVNLHRRTALNAIFEQ